MSAPSLLRSACISNGSSAGLCWRHQWEHRCWKMSLSCSTDWNKWDWTVSGGTFASTCLQYRNKTHRSGHKVTGICGWDELTAKEEGILFNLHKQIICLELPAQRDLHNFYIKVSSLWHAYQRTRRKSEGAQGKDAWVTHHSSKGLHATCWSESKWHQRCQSVTWMFPFSPYELIWKILNYSSKVFYFTV